MYTQTMLSRAQTSYASNKDPLSWYSHLHCLLSISIALVYTSFEARLKCHLPGALPLNFF